MKQSLLISFFCFFNFLTTAQSVEQLKAELSKSKAQSESIHIMNNLAYALSNEQPDSGLAYAERALKSALANNNNFEVARANSARGINYMVKSMYPLALEYLLKSLQQFEAMDSLTQAGGTNSNICLVYMNQSDYKSAMMYALKALSVYEEIDEKQKQAIVLENIGTLFFRQGELEKTIDYYEKARHIYDEVGDDQGLARNNGNMGMVLSKQGNYDAAKDAFLEALAINRRLEKQRSIQINMSNLGLLESRKGNYDKALLYYDTTEVMAKSLGLKLDFATNRGNIGEVYLKMATQSEGHKHREHLDKAISYITEGIEKCLALNSGDPAIGFYVSLSEAYATKGEYQKALEVYKKMEVLEDSIHSSSNKISIENMVASHDLALINRDLHLKNQELKIKELELSESRQRVGLYVMGLIILILIGIVTIYLLRKSRRRNRMLAESNALYALKIEEQLDSLKRHTTVLDEISYMQAHHVREPVATILGMVEHFNIENPHDPMNIFILENLSMVAEKLDIAVREVINKKEEITEQ